MALLFLCCSFTIFSHSSLSPWVGPLFRKSYTGSLIDNRWLLMQNHYIFTWVIQNFSVWSQFFNKNKNLQYPHVKAAPKQWYFSMLICWPVTLDWWPTLSSHLTAPILLDVLEILKCCILMKPNNVEYLDSFYNPTSVHASW